MMFQQIDQKASKWSGIAALLVFVSLATSWALKTPELTQKAQKLDQVEQHEIPTLKTQLKQANCDKHKLSDVAVQGILAQKLPLVPAPDWKDLKPCPKVNPVPPALAIEAAK